MYRFVFVLLVSTVYGQLQINGTCDFSSLNPYTNISPLLAGKWYQIQRIPNSFENGDCAFTTITFDVDNVTSIVNSLNKYDSEVANGKLVTRNASITATSRAGVFNVTYNDGISLNGIILGTDNTEYLVLYSCQDNGTTSTISAWKFGRNTTYSDNASTATHTLAVNAKIHNTTWKVINHSQAACKISGAVNLQISPILLILLTIGLAKDL